MCRTTNTDLLDE
jgi:tetratricopeptide repeat protein 21B